MDERENQAAEFFKAMDRVRRAWKSVNPCENISKSQFGTLMTLCHYGRSCDGTERPVSLSKLAELMNQSVPALSQRVRSLELMGFVERVPDENDRRVSGIRLTGEGREVLRLSRAHFTGILMQAMDELGSENAEMLTALLSRLAAAFENAVEKSSPEGRE